MVLKSPIDGRISLLTICKEFLNICIWIIWYLLHTHNQLNISKLFYSTCFVFKYQMANLFNFYDELNSYVYRMMLSGKNKNSFCSKLYEQTRNHSS